MLAIRGLRVLCVRDFKILLVDPTQSDLGETTPRFVLAQQPVALIQGDSRASQTYIAVAIARGTTTFTRKTR
ncbi:MAG TPA: hypothetical protein DCE55_01980, partial [Planctomycetaceae bacterium]|nr:hypothetical protein [Planctomycetaceae bacterium]